MKSLRSRLIVGTVVATAAIYATSAVVLYVSIRRSLMGEFDGALLARARSLVMLTEQGQKGVKLDLDREEESAFAAGKAEGFVMLNADGDAVARSSDPEGKWWDFPRFEGRNEKGNLQLKSGERVRFVELQFVPRAEEDEPPLPEEQRERLTLIVVRNAAGLLGKLQRLGWLLIGVSALMVAASAGIMAWVVGRGLRPLKRIAARIGQLDEDDLAGRVNVAGTPEEMQPVVDRLNELLGRLEGSFNRERAFTADVAHELRTPLAGLTTAMEVCTSQRREALEYETTMRKCMGVSKWMRGMVENLLMLARADARQIQPRKEDLRLEQVLRDAWGPFEERSRLRGVKEVWNVLPGAMLWSDRGLVETVMSNLFDNAVTYVDGGGTVEVRAREEDDWVLIEVSNSGCEVKGEQAERVFERFWRGDAARSMAGEHCGLGMAICKRIVELLGGEIEVKAVKGGRFEVRVKLPAKC